MKWTASLNLFHDVGTHAPMSSALGAASSASHTPGVRLTTNSFMAHNCRVNTMSTNGFFFMRLFCDQTDCLQFAPGRMQPPLCRRLSFHARCGFVGVTSCAQPLPRTMSMPHCRFWCITILPFLSMCDRNRQWGVCLYVEGTMCTSEHSSTLVSLHCNYHRMKGK